MAPPVLRVTLALPPSVNHMYANITVKGRRMRVYTTEAKKWRKKAGWDIKNAINKARWKALDEKTVMEFWAYWPTLHERDMDNLLKITQDALKTFRVVTSDHYIIPRAMDYDLDRTDPRLELCIWPKKLEGGPPTILGATTSGIALSCDVCPALSATEDPATPTTGPPPAGA